MQNTNQTSCTTSESSAATNIKSTGCCYKKITFKQLLQLISDDLYRYNGQRGKKCFLKHFLFGIGSKYTIWFRICSFLYSNRLTKYTLGIPARMILNHYRFKFGIELFPGTDVGPGLYIGHFGTIIISGGCKIGANCNLSQGVTIGIKSSGSHPGAPLIGNNVYIGPGAKLIGGISIGDNCVIGANAVVTKDFPPNSIIAGIPARNIGDSSELKYVNNRCCY